LLINEGNLSNINPADIVYMLSGASSIVPSISTGTTTGAPKVVTVGGMGQAKPPVPYGLVVLIVALAVMVGLTMAIVALRLAIKPR
jgi:glutamate dehydrogenase/leucine dehydrogenase